VRCRRRLGGLAQPGDAGLVVDQAKRNQCIGQGLVDGRERARPDFAAKQGGLFEAGFDFRRGQGGRSPGQQVFQAGPARESR